MTDIAEVRRTVVELHRELLAAQRMEAERIGGRMSASEVLQAATEDLRFSWLRELSELVAAFDEAERNGAEGAGRSLVSRTKELLAPPDGGTAFGARYLRALQDHPGVVMAALPHPADKPPRGTLRRGAVMSALVYRERPAAGEPSGLLVLHHGRGADEHDLLGLADVLDPQRRLHVVTPRGPLTIPGWPGNHWYVVPRVGYPDPDTFNAAYRKLADFHDGLWQRTSIGPEQTVFGGFSMGSVMSYSLGLGGERPAPAGILAFSGFIPTVDGWEPRLADRTGLRAFIAHGRRDPIMGVGFARSAHELLEGGGIEVTYNESDAAHHIDPEHVPAAVGWLSSVIKPATSRA